jgi:hypothetical protein
MVDSNKSDTVRSIPRSKLRNDIRMQNPSPSHNDRDIIALPARKVRKILTSDIYALTRTKLPHCLGQRYVSNVRAAVKSENNQLWVSRDSLNERCARVATAVKKMLQHAMNKAGFLVPRHR